MLRSPLDVMLSDPLFVVMVPALCVIAPLVACRLTAPPAVIELFMLMPLIIAIVTLPVPVLLSVVILPPSEALPPVTIRYSRAEVVPTPASVTAPSAASIVRPSVASVVDTTAEPLRSTEPPELSPPSSVSIATSEPRVIPPVAPLKSTLPVPTLSSVLIPPLSVVRPLVVTLNASNAVPPPTTPLKAMSPVPAVKSSACAPLTVPLKVIALLFEFMLTAADERVSATMVKPSYPLQSRPANSTAPAILVAVSPFASVTLSWNFRLVAAPAVIPELPTKVLWKSTRPVAALSTVRAAPVPSPNALTAPLTVVVPAPALSVKSYAPVKVFWKEMFPATPAVVLNVEQEVNVTGPSKVILAVLVVILSPN